MGKVIFIVLLVLVVCHAAFGQFRVGTIAGGTVSRFVFEDEEYKDAFTSGFGPGYHLGIMLNYRVSRKYSLHTELTFVKKGINVRNKDGINEVRNKAAFSYLSVPALLRFSTHKFIGNQHVEVYLNIGPEVNYWLGGNGILRSSEPAAVLNDGQLIYKVRFYNDDNGFGRYMVVEEPFRIQMAVAAGGGVIFDLGREQHIGIDLRTSLGLGKSFHGRQGGGDYGLQLYSENLEGVHHTLALSASWFMNFDLNTLMRKGRVSYAH